MWPYKAVTRLELERKKDLVEALLRALGCQAEAGPAHRVVSIGPSLEEAWVSQRPLYRYGGGWYRVSEVLYPEKPFLVLEWADTLAGALENCMEDLDPFPWDLTEAALREVLRAALNGG